MSPYVFSLDARPHGAPSITPRADGAWVVSFEAAPEMAPVAGARVVLTTEQLAEIVRQARQERDR